MKRVISTDLFLFTLDLEEYISTVKVKTTTMKVRAGILFIFALNFYTLSQPIFISSDLASLFIHPLSRNLKWIFIRQSEFKAAVDL